MHSLFIIGCLALAGCTPKMERFAEHEAEKIAEEVTEDIEEEVEQGEFI